MEYEAGGIENGGSGYSAEILKLDKLASGEDREMLLHDHLPNAKVFIRRNEVMGFYLPTLNEGLVISTDKLAGIELLKLRLQHKSVCILPEGNEAGINFLTQHDFKFYQRGSRMSLGSKAELRPEMLFNRVGGNIG